jgi:hypothetical protein
MRGGLVCSTSTSSGKERIRSVGSIINRAVLSCTVIFITTTSMSRLCHNAAASSAGLGGKARSLHHPLYLEKVSKD